MGGVQSNVAISNQTIQNNMLQSTSNVCKSVCTNTRNGGQVIIKDGTNWGELDLSQSCTANSTCIISTNMSSTVNNVLDALLKQQQSAQQSVFAFTLQVQTNVTDLEQNIQNNLTQVINSSCQASATNTQNNPFVYIGNSNNMGKINLSQAASSNASCQMTNVAGIQLTNEATAKIDQGQKITSVMAIIALVILAIIILIIVFLFKGGKKDGGAGGKGTGPFKLSPSQQFAMKHPEVLRLAGPEGQAAATAIQVTGANKR